MSDRVVDASNARDVDGKARQDNPLLGWVISKEDPDHPGKMVARLVTGTTTPFTLLGETLAEIHRQLPPGLERSERQPSDPPNVVEIWFAT